MAKATITVRAHPDLPEGEVALWERDDLHPDGEVYIVADGRECEVGETPAVNAGLATKRLARVERRAARESQPEAPARAPSQSRRPAQAKPEAKPEATAEAEAGGDAPTEGESEPESGKE